MTAHKTKYYCSTDQVKTKHNSGQNEALNGKENIGQSGQLTCSAVHNKLVMKRLDMEDENMPDKEAVSRSDSVAEAVKSDKQNQGNSRLYAKRIPNHSKLLDSYNKEFDEEDHNDCVVGEGGDSGTLKTQSSVKENSNKKNLGVDSDRKDCHESDNAAVQLDSHFKSNKGNSFSLSGFLYIRKYYLKVLYVAAITGLLFDGWYVLGVCERSYFHSQWIELKHDIFEHMINIKCGLVRHIFVQLGSHSAECCWTCLCLLGLFHCLMC